MITLKNDYLNVIIAKRGAELQSITANDKEYLWDANPEFWPKHAPLMFPICGGLMDDKFEYQGKEYTLNKHGYGSVTMFALEESNDTEAVFLHISNEETKKVFPFDYELRVKYKLTDNKIEVTYEVTNKTDGEMYFSIGSHEAYCCPEGIEDYTLHFAENENLVTNALHGNYLSKEEVTVLGENTNVLPLKYDYFKIDALTFLNLKSKSITLKHNNSDKTVKVDYEGFPYVFVWTKPGAGYICIEPWCGIPDFEDSGYDFTKKIGINKLLKGEVFTRTHTITIG